MDLHFENDGPRDRAIDRQKAVPRYKYVGMYFVPGFGHEADAFVTIYSI